MKYRLAAGRMIGYGAGIELFANGRVGVGLEKRMAMSLSVHPIEKSGNSSTGEGIHRLVKDHLCQQFNDIVHADGPGASAGGLSILLPGR